MAAFVGGDPCVSAFMSGEIAGLDKTLAAPLMVTDKGLAPCVGVFVPDEITGLGKTLVAPVK
ncbi:hypothetical protein, partial [Sansalvadorimonas verongulae]|uniref:hypothetical protein n=1 Tax=Sansalvadorimonas verongulae TaxID=2172824 RepID=UPI001E611CB1